MVLKQRILRRRRRLLWNRRENFCPESEIREEVSLAGLRPRFPELEPGGDGALHWEGSSFRWGRPGGVTPPSL